MDLGGHLQWSECGGSERSLSIPGTNHGRPACTLRNIMTKLPGILLYGVN